MSLPQERSTAEQVFYTWVARSRSGSSSFTALALNKPSSSSSSTSSSSFLPICFQVVGRSITFTLDYYYYYDYYYDYYYYYYYYDYCYYYCDTCDYNDGNYTQPRRVL